MCLEGERVVRYINMRQELKELKEEEEKKQRIKRLKLSQRPTRIMYNHSSFMVYQLVKGGIVQ